MSEPDFEGVLAAHQFSVHQSPQPIFEGRPHLTKSIWGCTCGWVGQDQDGTTPGEVHRAHVASALESVAHCRHMEMPDSLWSRLRGAEAALAALTTTDQEDR